MDKTQPPSKPLYTIACDFCGTLKTTPYPQTKYCCDQCRNDAKYYRIKGDPGVAPRKPRTKRVIRCETCGKRKKTSFAHTLYCSDPCQWRAKYQRRKAARAAKKAALTAARKAQRPPKPQRVITCLVCGTKRQTTSPLTVYCSPNCGARAYYLRKKHGLPPRLRVLDARPPCPRCGGTHITKLTRDKNGKQRYRCHHPDCTLRSFILDYVPTEQWEARRKIIIAMAIEGKRVRETARLLGINAAIVSRIRKKGRATILAAWKARGFQ